jgi:single-stranded-DNA-specific exonuclease
MHNRRWVIQPPITPQAQEALEKFPSILKQILFNRGYGTDAEARTFLKAQPNTNMDPFQLIGMGPAVDRIKRALANNEPIAIYGDYDVDGVTSTALLVQALEGLGGNVRGYIPNRFDEGYGLNTDALDSLKEEGIQ